MCVHTCTTYFEGKIIWWIVNSPCTYTHTHTYIYTLHAWIIYIYVYIVWNNSALKVSRTCTHTQCVVAVCCSVLQCVAARCSVLQCVACLSNNLALKEVEHTHTHTHTHTHISIYVHTSVHSASDKQVVCAYTWMHHSWVYI